jgi:hypothetical protein
MKIVSIDDDAQSTTDQHVIEINRSLFSNEYGNIVRYEIYIRQGKHLLSFLLENISLFIL